MASLVHDCPRCGANRMTFDSASKAIYLRTTFDWKNYYELAAICRRCGLHTIFVVAQLEYDPPREERIEFLLETDQNIDKSYEVDGYVSLKDIAAQPPPEHVPDEVAAAFREASTSIASKCWNAAGAMFRSAIDIATRGLLPEEETEGLNPRTRRDLGLRLPWLFSKGLLPRDLEKLSDCVREDGNDGAHAAILGKEDADNLLDFTVALLERIYTEPERLKEAEARRIARRQPKSDDAV